MSDQSSIFQRVTKRLDDLQVWLATGGILWAVFGAAAKNMKLLGNPGWADAIIVGALFAIVMLLGLTGSLAMYRLFRPIYSQKHEHRSIISGNRGLITKYYREGKGQTFRDIAEHEAVFLFVRRYLSEPFFEKFYAAESNGEPLFFDPTVRLYMDEIDKLADSWKIA